MFKGFGKPKNTAIIEEIEVLKSHLDCYEWLKNEVANDSEATQLLAQCVMRFTKWVDTDELDRLASIEQVESIQFNAARMLTAQAYMAIAVMFAQQGMPPKNMTKPMLIRGVTAATDDHIKKLIVDMGEALAA